MALAILSCLQNRLKWFDRKFGPASEIIFFGSPNSVNTILATIIRSSADEPSDFFMIETSCSNLQYTIAFYYFWKIHQHPPPPIACTVDHMALSSHVTVC